MMRQREYKIIARFYKGGPARFISHLDFVRFIYRAMRRADLPFAATEGFSPRPKVSFGQALKVGSEGEVEVGFVLREQMPLAEFQQRVTAQLGEDIRMMDAGYGQ
ncbi:MAG: TIGR03936 family radical SAM-associated protein [Candidatus Omnitrophica bacterium]|nr:TIGR03936 family radical SAM-associated protein [Candidatus Omnitrophota bacterium]